MPPLGLITVAALCPEQWAIRLVDLALEELSDEGLLWADLVMVSAMQVQRDDVHRTLQCASKLGRRTFPKRNRCRVSWRSQSKQHSPNAA